MLTRATLGILAVLGFACSSSEPIGMEAPSAGGSAGSSTASGTATGDGGSGGGGGSMASGGGGGTTGGASGSRGNAGAGGLARDGGPDQQCAGRGTPGSTWPNCGIPQPDGGVTSGCCAGTTCVQRCPFRFAGDPCAPVGSTLSCYSGLEALSCMAGDFVCCPSGWTYQRCP
jgi:hypothetical protein